MPQLRENDPIILRRRMLLMDRRKMLEMIYRDLSFIALYDDSVLNRLRRTAEADRVEGASRADARRFREVMVVVRAYLRGEGPRLGGF